MSFVYFSLACAGLTQILVYGKIFDKIRPTEGWFGKLLSCTMCTGFWSGIFLWSLNDYTKLFNFDYSFATALCMGCVGSMISYIFDSAFGDEGIRVDHN